MSAKNVLGNDLEPCSKDPLTGFYRTGSCETGPEDRGVHVVCARVTLEFLQFSLAQGNDLVTPRPEFGFPGLEPGDSWCLCAARWQEALAAKVAPPVVLAATHEAALRVVALEDLQTHAAPDSTEGWPSVEPQPQRFSQPPSFRRFPVLASVDRVCYTGKVDFTGAFAAPTQR